MTDIPKPPIAKSVTLHLPPDLIVAIARLSRELGQPQSEVLISALRHGLEQYAALPRQPLDLTDLSDRLTALEVLPAQVAELAAQVDRLLNASVTKPPSDSIDASSSAAESSAAECPRCTQRLSAPLKSSGRQVCIKCGWTNKPRPARLESSSDLPPDELKQLLDRAAADAIANMKPKKQPAPSPPKFPFGRL